MSHFVRNPVSDFCRYFGPSDSCDLIIVNWDNPGRQHVLNCRRLLTMGDNNCPKGKSDFARNVTMGVGDFSLCYTKDILLQLRVVTPLLTLVNSLLL